MFIQANLLDSDRMVPPTWQKYIQDWEHSCVNNTGSLSLIFIVSATVLNLLLKPNKHYQKLLDLLIRPHTFYKTHTNRKGLKEASEALNTKVVAPKKVTSTRWLPHLIDGINSLFQNFRSYEAHLSSASHTNPKPRDTTRWLWTKVCWCLPLFSK